MTKLKRCKKCGGEAVFSGVFDDPKTYRFPECMECGARAEGNNVKDSWYERAKKWNEQNTLTNEEWLDRKSTKEKAEWLDKVLMCCNNHDCPSCPIGEKPHCDKKGIEEWLKQPHKGSKVNDVFSRGKKPKRNKGTVCANKRSRICYFGRNEAGLFKS